MQHGPHTNGSLELSTAVWQHGFVRPNREQVSRFFCSELGPAGGGGASCSNASELNVSAGSAAAEWDDKALQVTSTGQVVTAPECGAAAGSPAATVHTFSSKLTQNNLEAVAARRAQLGATAFLDVVRRDAPVLAGYRQPPQPPPSPRFLGAQYTSPGGQGGGTGLVERYMLFGEGRCFSTLTLYLPPPAQEPIAPRDPMDAIVWYARDPADASKPAAGAAAFAAAGYMVAVASVCGFGESGGMLPPDSQTAASLTANVQPPGQGAEDMAHEIGRSLPGFHAGDMVRAHRFLRGRRDVRSLALVVTEDHLDVAAAVAALAEPAESPACLAMVAPRASLAAAALSRVYLPLGYHGWIFNLLPSFDLADLAAAAAGRTKLLVLGPRDGASLEPLTPAAAAAAYAFASAAAPPGALTIKPGAFDAAAVVQELRKWLGRAK